MRDEIEKIFRKAHLELDEGSDKLMEQLLSLFKKKVGGLKVNGNPAGYNSKTDYDEGYNDGFNQACCELNQAITELEEK